MIKMKQTGIYLLIVTIMIFKFTACNGQTKQNTDLINRKPCVAGQFYPGSAFELTDELSLLFSKAKTRQKGNVAAIISPHAGYAFSGEVAASAFNQLNPDGKWDRIFLIGSSHRVYFDGASVYNCGNFETPLGTVKVDTETANKLIKDCKSIVFRDDAHATEHSLEVQLPFLQYHLKNEFQIVPIIIATQSVETIKKIAAALKPYFNQNNLFVISSDFSHYPAYSSAVEVDSATALAILTNSPEKFLETININESKNIPNLATSICGWTSVLTLLEITSKTPGTEIKTIEYKNSGDAGFGDKRRVVGYWAMAVTRKTNEKTGDFYLDKADKINLLNIARQTIESYIKSGIIPTIDASQFSETLKTRSGAFVSLHKEGELRGCIGNFNPDEPLYLVVQDMAVSASTKDYRFPRVRPEELKEIEIEISVLTPLKKIDSADEIVLGKHGIYIKKGYNAGTFLPQVATQTGWSLEEFLGHCARDKAGIGWDGWRNAELFTYEALIFDDKELE
jgi:AmmeMemoRadiSam system protein B/AmmeMemoRadiSam system protein A